LVVSWERKDLAKVTNVFVDDRVLGLTSVGSVVVEERNERRTILQVSTDTIVLVALIDSLLKNVGTVDERRPTVDEIGVETVTGGISVGPSPGGLGTVVELEALNLEDEFVKQGNEVDRVGSGTITTIDTSRWPCHVRSVIVRVEVDTIPTIGEVDLSSDTLRTVVVGEETVSLIPVGVSSVGTRELETDIGDGLVAGRSIKVSSVGLTRKHSKTIGEGIDLLVLVSRSRKVVGIHVVDRDHGVGSIGRVVVVELRNPVVGLVLGDGCCGTTTSSHRLVGDTLTESGATSDGVDMTRDRSWVDDTDCQLGLTRHDRVLTGPIELSGESSAT
jgi:hypothetical protein